MKPLFYSQRVVKAQVLCGNKVKNKRGDVVIDENLDDFRNYVCDYNNYESQMAKAHKYFIERKHEIERNQHDPNRNYTTNTWVILQTVTDYYDGDNYYICSDIQEIDTYGL